MTRKTGSGQVLEFQGKVLDTPIDYSFEWDSFDGITEAKEQGAWPNEGQILKGINSDAEKSAKSTAYQAATKTLREAYMETPEYKRKQFIANAVKFGNGLSEADAAKLADSLGL